MVVAFCFAVLVWLCLAWVVGFSEAARSLRSHPGAAIAYALATVWLAAAVGSSFQSRGALGEPEYESVRRD